MITEKENITRGERIKLLATENRRRRERTLLSDKVSKFTGLPIAEDRFSVSVSRGEIYDFSGNVKDIVEFEIELPENYLEANRHLFAQFGSLTQEQVSIYIRFSDIWVLPLESEVAFSYIVEFCDLGGFRFATLNSDNVIDLSTPTIIN